MGKTILTINAGSSSIKFALYVCDASLTRLLSGRIDRIGLAGSTFTQFDLQGKGTTKEISIPDFSAAVQVLKKFLEQNVDFATVLGIGHRVVYGVGQEGHTLVTPELLKGLAMRSEMDPEHMPFEISLMEMFAGWQAAIPQVACFDTVFHNGMPRVAELLSTPRRFETQGVRRYGFHGLSYSFIAEELERIDPEKKGGRVIVAHLGNGVSLAALKDGQSIDTSMGFTPTGGVPMGSRSGDLDPGVLLYLMKKENLSIEAISSLVNHESGLLGVSETSSDMLDLLNKEDSDARAKEAVDLFCYEVKKRIGAYAAVLGGVDTLVFTGGMGENAPRIRRRVCAGLEFLGIALSETLNESNAALMSAPTASVSVRMMHTNEELIIARITEGLVKN